MFDLFYGRFQPFHNGHLAVIQQMQNPKIAIVKGKVSSNDKKKNPLEFDYQRDLILKVIPGADVVEVSSGYLPELINLFGVPDRVFCGDDRVGQYKAQLVREGIDAPIEFVITERKTSGTKVRQSIIDDDFESFMAQVPSDIWDQFTTLKEKVIV